MSRAHRDTAIATDHAARGETIKTLGARYGLHYSQISRILARAARRQHTSRRNRGQSRHAEKRNWATLVQQKQPHGAIAVGLLSIKIVALGSFALCEI